MNAPLRMPQIADGKPDLIDCATAIVAAYVFCNRLPPADVPGLLGTVHGALASLSTPAEPEPEVFATATPEQARRSISRDGIVSFIDGRSYKTLKRHLTAHGLTPERYRERYGLPADYPMTAPGYAAQRSALAKAIGLGVPGARTKRAPA